MKIEPCLYCGAELEINDENEGIAWCPTEGCPYFAFTVDPVLSAHNRLSRIVRAAETYVRVRHQYVKDVLAGGEFEVENVDGAMAVSIADRALVDAVEGGAE
jgi:hypothetical protein